MKRVLIVLVMALLVLSPLLGCKATTPVPEVPYYQGKTITVVVHTGIGGAVDRLNRLISKYLPSHIPGNPIMIIRNMTAGGGIVGCNYVYNVAEPDGLTILGGTSSTWLLNFLRPEGVNFKLEEMPGILNLTDSNMIYSNPAVVSDPRALFTTKGVRYGTQGPATLHGIGFLSTMDLLGVPNENLKYVWGYKGFATARHALLTGEIDMASGATIADVPVVAPYIESGEMVRLMQTGVFDAEGNVVKAASVPNVPSVPEIYQEVYGKPPSGQKWEAFKGLYIVSRVVGRPIVLPPGTPDFILDILTEASRNMLKDPEFQAAFNKMLAGSPLPTIVADIPVETWQGWMAMPPEVKESARALVAPHGIVLK